ncbi:FAD-binding protein [Pseudomonas sp. KCJK8993]|uniref:FAD-binding protein n=1 Tax=Pseudomonas sp. KCJK8993 TaxID=3344565 RepID=UPI003906380C
MSEKNHLEFDVIVVGSGPAGVSTAFPLVEAGLRVLMVDGGKTSQLAPPNGQFLDLRQHDAGQWNWMIGQDFHALRLTDAVSPKLRVPTHAATFDGFKRANRIDATDFVAVGSLAPGGLSNAWGCGVACLTAAELADYPFSPSDMRDSYREVAKRIGVSGARDDDMSEFFGLDEWSQEPVPVDSLHASLLERYPQHRERLQRNGFRLGRSRVAVLTEPRSGRHACDRSGNCLWGCGRRALYSATEDLHSLRSRQGFHYKPGFLVERVISKQGGVTVEGWGEEGVEVLHARRVLLAAGTLASTRLALQAVDHRAPVPMQSCPTAAFMLWLPRHLGRGQEAAFGLGQLSFSLGLSRDVQAFGSLFSATGIPVAEFARYMPFGKRYGVDLLTSLLPSCVIGNVFLPGAMTQANLRLGDEDQLVVRGGYREEVAALMKEAERLLRSSFRRLGAVLIPSSFKVGLPGADIHYAASLPMHVEPVVGQTDRYGELAGASGIHVVDGASLSALPAKSHTLTIMANADRIGRYLAQRLTAVGNDI